jgi:hypothetical protein
MAQAVSDITVTVAELIVVTGPPGAGEAAAARALSRLFERSVLVAGDDVFAFIARGYVAPWIREAHRQNGTVIGAAAAAAGRLAAGGYSSSSTGHRPVVLGGVHRGHGPCRGRNRHRSWMSSKTSARPSWASRRGSVAESSITAPPGHT